MVAKEYLDRLKNTLGIDLYQSPDPSVYQKQKKNLELHMQLKL